ncbi:hypothetical protein IVA88_09150 [Bradyrhizobium sp. 149]|uniref:hypothetical protein n=1 Tax=Bradyrhizobium sp. 149 TaxID=2782624 RepID=UPI001FFA96F4|nr:hypothetical protein [Bradyrhizobium sp. 149]MCK1651598.1 hypothetical protein [Bradyrhizobium sp. 149]
MAIPMSGNGSSFGPCALACEERRKSRSQSRPGPSLEALVRLPGGLASNFETGSGTAVVDLINLGDETRGYSDIIALDIAFAQSIPGQASRVFAVDD